MMTTILETFCGGLAFAAGALVGVFITAKIGASLWSKRHADLLELQSRAENRLATQVQLLEQMSRALEVALNREPRTENRELNAPFPRPSALGASMRPALGRA